MTIYFLYGMTIQRMMNWNGSYEISEDNYNVNNEGLGSINVKVVKI